ncbi:MAG: ubiquinone biosynthesis protein [Rubrivivax sp.]|nr:MAG: ubiquinone biosynthesis protein [Rubrivivax sp.]
MGGFANAALSYPTAIYTALLGVVLLYWIMAVLGVVDFESSGIDIDLDLHADGQIDDLGVLASYVVGFGLNGVPFSIVVSLIVLFAWTLSCLAGMWVLPWVPTTILQWVAGTLVLLLSFVMSIPATAALVRPMRRLFVSHTAVVNAALVGQMCKVVTQTVDNKLGRAEIARRGTSINIRVWAHTPNTLNRGSVARVLEYDEGTGRYLIEADR